MFGAKTQQKPKTAISREEKTLISLYLQCLLLEDY